MTRLFMSHGIWLTRACICVLLVSMGFTFSHPPFGVFSVCITIVNLTMVGLNVWIQALPCGRSRPGIGEYAGRLFPGEYVEMISSPPIAGVRWVLPFIRPTRSFRGWRLRNAYRLRKLLGLRSLVFSIHD